MSKYPDPVRPGDDSAIAEVLVTLALLAALAGLVYVSCACRATLPAMPCAGATTGLETPPPPVNPSGLSKPATAALQRAQAATVCVSTEVRAARQTLAADVAPTLPGPAAAVDARLGRVEKAAAEMPPALATLAAAAVAKPAPPVDLGDRRVWRWAAAFGALAMLGGVAAMVLARIWQVGPPRIGAGIAVAGAAVTVTSYVWQTWATVLVWCAGALCLLALVAAAYLLYRWTRLNWDSLIETLKMDRRIKGGATREQAKAVAVAEQSPAVAAAIARAKRVLPILPPLPPATPTPPPASRG